MNNKILVLGGTGKTGKRVAERLIKHGEDIQIGSRTAAIPFDWEKESLWDKVLTGIKKVYLVYQPDLSMPEAANKIRIFVKKAAAAGVNKIVMLSGRGEKESEQCEDIVRQSGLEWTVVRASWFMQNFSEGFFLDSIVNGEMVVPYIKAREPFVDVDDIADVAVAALRDDVHNGKIYSLTGAELLSFEEATSLIAQAINHPIHFRSVSMETYVADLRSFQLPETFIWLIQYLFTEVLDGRNESTTEDIATVLKRTPTTFQEYISKTKLTGVWNSQ